MPKADHFRRIRVLHHSVLVAAALTAAAQFAPVGSAIAATYFVDNQNPLASDSNPGTAALPYRTIQAAVTARAAAGNVVQVAPGTYREQVTIPASGAAGNPFAVRAPVRGAIVEGADDFSSNAQWTQLSGNVWRAASVTWSPAQAIVDGARYVPSTVTTPSQIPSGTFLFVAGSGLYLNAGGGNPGSHGAQIGRRTYGFYVSGRSFVTIAGFEVRRSDSKGIYLSGPASDIEVSGNLVSFARNFGIHANGTTVTNVAGNMVWASGDHGIYLSNGVTNSSIHDNDSFQNARPAVRAANGIHLAASSNNRLERNRVYDNQDTGFQFNSDSHDNLCVQNKAWRNGDHGYDHLNSWNIVHVGDLAWNNFKDGFSFEGNAPGGRLHDCIAVDNGLTTNEFNVWVDVNSLIGFASDYNLIWNSTSQAPVKVGGTIYPTVAAYRTATGRDAHSISAAPRFLNPGAGDFHLTAGSAAIDRGTSSIANWPALDCEARPRIDDPAVANAGTGPIAYSDIGPHEYAGGGPPPVDLPPILIAPAAVTVAEGSLLQFTVRASDAEPITSLTANLGGLPAGHNATCTPTSGDTATFRWTPSFTHAGVYTVTFRAANTLATTATTTITVLNTDRAPVVSAPASVRSRPSVELSFTVSASDADGDAILALTANLSQLPSGHNASFTANASKTSGTFRWTPQSGQNGNYDVTFTASNARSGSATTRIQIRRNGVTSDEPAELEGLPETIALSSGHPNPSVTDVSFALALPRAAYVDWSIHDLQGRTLRRESGEFGAGRTALRWDGRDGRGRRLPAGVYLVRVSADGMRFVRRVALQ